MSVPFDPFASPSQRSAWLASAALPRRVRDALEELYALLADELSRQLERMLADYESQLFRLADQARNHSLQGQHFETLRALRQNRGDLVPRFLSSLESSLSLVREPAKRHAATASVAPLVFQDMRLIGDDEASEDTMLRTMALRQDSRASLPLQLLGQRFGVLAGAPAFDAESLPVGPHQLGRLFQDASSVLQLGIEARQLLLRTFDRQVLAGYEPLCEMMNALLARHNVLPGLSFVPLRKRKRAQPRDLASPATAEDAVPGATGTASLDRGHGNPSQGTSPSHGDPSRSEPSRDRRSGGDPAGGNRTGSLSGGNPSESGRSRGDHARGDAPRNGPLALDPQHAPHTGWMGDAAPTDPVAETAAFDMLQQLLAERRNLVGKLRPAGATQSNASAALPTRDVLSVLGKLQGASPAPRNVAEVRQALLLQGRQQGGEPVSMSREDSDTFELLGMLYTEIGRELREGAANTSLLERLQVPLLRVALQDREFFVRQHHPARQLLNAVAESGARWLAEDDADPHLGAQLQQAVDHVVDNYDGDPQVFEAANHALQEQLHSMARKAEVAERRHVEAARGKEKLVLAKQRAAAVLDEAINNQRLPKFLHALLNQAWADVLTLTLLRHGEDSDEWKQQLQATAQIVSASADGTPAPTGLDRRIESALAQVGYHADEASVIARRLTTAGPADADDDAASRTELAMKLKARGRLGEDAVEKAAPLPPRTPGEDACYGQLRTTPFGTWFEFARNQQGDMVRRRLSWFSPITDNALFVNQRGQRIGEHSLDALARMMANGQARIVTADKGHLVDRAWQAALNALRHLGGRGDSSPSAFGEADA